MAFNFRGHKAEVTSLRIRRAERLPDKHYYDKEVTRDEAKENFSVFKKKAKK